MAPVQINIGKDPLVVPSEARTGTSSYQVVSSAPSPVGCANGRLPNSVLRNSGVVRNLPAGAWLWHDGNGFQLRVTHSEHASNGSPTQKIFRGSITTTAKFAEIGLVRLEANDRLFVRRPSERHHVRTAQLHRNRWTAVPGWVQQRHTQR